MKVAALAELILGILHEGGPMDAEEIDYQLGLLRRRPGPSGEALAILERGGKVRSAPWSDGGTVWSAVAGAEVSAAWVEENTVPSAIPNTSPARPDKTVKVLKQMRERVDDRQLVKRIDRMIENPPPLAKPKRSEVAIALERVRAGKPTPMGRLLDELGV